MRTTSKIFLSILLFILLTFTALLKEKVPTKYDGCDEVLPIYYTDTVYVKYCVETDKIYRFEKWVEPTFIERRHIENALK